MNKYIITKQAYSHLLRQKEYIEKILLQVSFPPLSNVAIGPVEFSREDSWDFDSHYVLIDFNSVNVEKYK